MDTVVDGIMAVKARGLIIDERFILWYRIVDLFDSLLFLFKSKIMRFNGDNTDRDRDNRYKATEIVVFCCARAV